MSCVANFLSHRLLVAVAGWHFWDALGGTVPAGAKPNSCCHYTLHAPQAEGYLVNYHEFDGPHIVSDTDIQHAHRNCVTLACECRSVPGMSKCQALCMHRCHRGQQRPSCPLTFFCWCRCLPPLLEKRWPGLWAARASRPAGGRIDLPNKRQECKSGHQSTRSVATRQQHLCALRSQRQPLLFAHCHLPKLRCDVCNLVTRGMCSDLMFGKMVRNQCDW